MTSLTRSTLDEDGEAMRKINHNNKTDMEEEEEEEEDVYCGIGRCRPAWAQVKHILL